MKRKLAVTLCVASLAPLALVACGDDDEEPATTAGGAETTEATETTGGGGTGGGGDTVDITAAPDGSLAYQEESVTAEAGEVTIELDNPASLGHDVQVETPEGENLGGTEVISEDTATTTLELDAGDYTFYCSVPGHREGGMEGTLKVE